MPRVLLLCEYPTLLGGERSALATLDAVRAAGFEVLAAAPSAGPLHEALRQHRVTTAAWNVRPGMLLEAKRALLREIIAATTPDLVHANSLAMGRIAGPVTAAMGVPSLAHLRDIIKLSAATVADLNCHGRLIAVSQATADHHLAQGLDANKVRVVYNGIDLETFRPRAATGYLHRELGLPTEGKLAPLVAAIGQISLRKGLDIFLAALERAAYEHPDAVFLVVGDRHSPKRETRELHEQLRVAEGLLAGRLHLLGTREDIPQLLNELTLLVHPARQEPFGRVLLEAAASGVPVIATDVGGTRELFGSSPKAVELIAKDNPEALAEAIVTLLASPAQRRSQSLAARTRVAARFTISQAASNLIDCYRELIGGT